MEALDSTRQNEREIGFHVWYKQLFLVQLCWDGVAEGTPPKYLRSFIIRAENPPMKNWCYEILMSLGMLSQILKVVPRRGTPVIIKTSTKNKSTITKNQNLCTCTRWDFPETSVHLISVPLPEVFVSFERNKFLKPNYSQNVASLEHICEINIWP